MAQNPRFAGDAGLTLLELLVVVTILVLLSVAIGTVALNYLGGAKADAARLQISQIEAGLDLFKLDLGRYPSDAEGLDALIQQPANADRWNGPYVRKAASLVDPWGETFQYRLDPGGKQFELVSLGADKTLGGEGDAADITSR